MTSFFILVLILCTHKCTIADHISVHATHNLIIPITQDEFLIDKLSTFHGRSGLHIKVAIDFRKRKLQRKSFHGQRKARDRI